MNAPISRSIHYEKEHTTIVSIILAFLNYDVYCMYFSDDLSKRDNVAFAGMFDKLNVTEHIEYATFTSICETMINKRFNIRHINETNVVALIKHVCRMSRNSASASSEYSQKLAGYLAEGQVKDVIQDDFKIKSHTFMPSVTNV